MNSLAEYKSALSMDDAVLLTVSIWARARSKDPRTKVGAAVLHKPTGAIFYGYNGFPAGLPDYKRYWDCRDLANPDNKYRRVQHAELGAVRKAHQCLGQLGTECVLYCTHYICAQCMKDSVLPSGIKRVVYASNEHFDQLTKDFADAMGITLEHRDIPKFDL